MAGIAFKQSCPSCEVAIPIRDVGLVGKKIECPKCKYRFVVQKPKKAEEAAVTPAPPTKSAKPAAVKAKTGALRHIEEDEVEDTVAGKGASRKKLYLGLGLGGVGVAVLALASYLILGKGSPKLPTSTVPIVNSGKSEPDDDPKVDEKDPPNIDGKVEVKVDPKSNVPKIVEDVVLTPAGPELTNLLPNDTEHVLHAFFKEVFDVLSPFRSPITDDTRALPDGVSKTHLGFGLAEIDDFIRADRFTGKPWTFTVIHLKAPIDEKAVNAAFGLKNMPSTRGHDYFKVTKQNPWFDQLSHVALGVPQWLRLIGRDDSRPLFVRFHDRQTLIFANEAPMLELLKSNLQFPFLGDGPAVPRDAPPAKAGGEINKGKIDDAPDAADVDPAKNAARAKIYTKSYLTIKPKLREMLDRLEAKPGETPEKPLFCTATELEPVRVPANLLSPDERGKMIWRGKQIWDLASMLDERKPRLTFAGSALIQRDARSFQYRSEFECAEEKEAKSVLKFVDETIAPEVARNFERYLNHKIEIPKLDPPQPNPAGVFGDPQPMKDVSKWEATQRDQTIDVRVDLVLDNATLGRIRTLTGLFAMAARAEVEVVADRRGRHSLGDATIESVKNGRDDRNVAAGSFPPGTVKRPNGPSRIGNSPYYRLSWMTSLLPYLGQKDGRDGGLYTRIDFASSWRDPVNWFPARTIVPEFLDGSYPEAARFVTVPGIGVAPAATHFVGIAGVGLDAADYSRDDPAFADNRGVFGYDRSATMAELQKGRGAANVIMVLQVPHDGLTSVSPWIAGGGSTVRGIPEKNSLAPFVLSNEKNGKPITYKGRRGTYAIMADSSVRFLDAATPDDVVKALCTVQGPGPKADFFADEKFPLVPDPAAKGTAKVAELKAEAAPQPAKAAALEAKKP